MKQVKGFWLPDDEEHLIPFLESGPIVYGGPTYQYHKIKAALDLVPKDRRKLAVDVGGHCGLWSRILVNEFRFVEAFEPVERHRECFRENLINYTNWRLRPVALGDRIGDVALVSEPHSSGGTFIQRDGPYKSHMSRLDLFPFDRMDFLKIDCEGWEYFVIKGGEETIRRDKPTIIVEQKEKNWKHHDLGIGPTEACKLLKKWGATLRFVMSGDYCFTW